MSVSRFFDGIQRFLSKSDLVVHLLVKFRNQANRVIAYNCATSHQSSQNGEELILQQLGKELEVVFDVGANKGEWSQMFLDNKGSDEYKLFLFEPGNEANKILQKKFGDNPRVRIRNIGLSNRNAVECFYEEKSAGEQSGFCITPYHSNYTLVEVEVARLDTECESNGISYIDYLKLDCEGYDSFIIKGAESMLKRSAIKYIQFEYGISWVSSGATLKSTIDFLQKYNYTIKLITPLGLKSFDVNFFGEFFGYANFLAIQESFKQ